jgi:hypothetical protein
MSDLTPWEIEKLFGMIRRAATGKKAATPEPGVKVAASTSVGGHADRHKFVAGANEYLPFRWVWIIRRLIDVLIPG